MSRIPVDAAVSQPKTDADWRAQGDANTIIRATEIMNDEKRFKAAKKWISVEVIEAQERLKAAVSAEAKISKKG